MIKPKKQNFKIEPVREKANGMKQLIGGAAKIATGNPLGGALDIGDSLLGGIGINLNGRKKKRQKRDKYRQALISMGVSSAKLDNWTSDHYKSGWDFEKIIKKAGEKKGVKYINEKLALRPEITMNLTKRLVRELPNWLESKNNNNNSAGSGSTGSTNQVNEQAVKGLSFLGLLALIWKWIK